MKKLDWGKLIKFPNAYGVGFYLCVVLMVVLMYCVGTIPAILVFSITATLFLKRLPLKKNLIFSTLWTTSLYIVFVVLLQIRFEPGLLLK